MRAFDPSPPRRQDCEEIFRPLAGGKSAGAACSAGAASCDVAGCASANWAVAATLPPCASWLLALVGAENIVHAANSPNPAKRDNCKKYGCWRRQMPAAEQRKPAEPGFPLSRHYRALKLKVPAPS